MLFALTLGMCAIAAVSAIFKVTKIDPATGRMERLGFIPVEPGWWHWAWGYYFGGKLVGDDGRLTVDDPKNIEAFKWVTKFANRYGREKLLAFKQGVGSFDSPQNAFMSQRVGMVLQGVAFESVITVEYKVKSSSSSDTGTFTTRSAK